MHGVAVIERVRTEDPAAYLQTVASLMLRKVEVDATLDFAGMTDAQHDSLNRQVAAREGLVIELNKATEH